MNPDRSTVTSFKLSNSFLTKLEECVKKFDFKDNSSFIRESIQVGMDFLEGKENHMSSAEDAKKFLEKIEPRFNSLKRNEAILTIYKDLSKDEQEAIFYQMDLDRKNKIISERDLVEKKLHAFRCGYELEPKVGYRLTRSGNHEFYRPILPRDSEWDLMTQEQKISLLEEQRKKLSDFRLKSDNNSDFHNSIQRNIDEISKGLETDSELESQKERVLENE